MPPDIESTSAAPADRPNAGRGFGLGAWFRSGRAVWLIAAAAVPQSLVAAMLMALVIYPGGGGKVPGIVFFLALTIAGVWLSVVWGLVALAALVRRKAVRLVVLALLALPDVWCVPFSIESAIGAIKDARYSAKHPPPNDVTGEGYFAYKTDRDLVVAIRACAPGAESRGLVCDLDKVAALARTTNVYAAGLAGYSQMDLALRNAPNPDVLRILLRTGKPPAAEQRLVFDHVFAQKDLTLLRAALDAGLDPSGFGDSEKPLLTVIMYSGWTEGFVALLDAGARIDQTDNAGYTVLMRAIEWRSFEMTALLLARGAAEDRVASDGTTMEMLVGRIPPEDRKRFPPSVLALVDRHRPR